MIMLRSRVIPALLLALAAAAGLDPFAARGPAASTKGFVLTTDYTTGTLSVVDLDTRVVTPDVASVSPDPFERWYQGLLYVVNRLGYDNVQVIDPAQGYATIRQFSVGNGTNPQDIAFVSPAKAYVSRLASPDLLIVNPATGATLGVIPLAPWADGDGNPEAARMTMLGDLLFVALERLTNFVPADTGLVVVIDTRADTVYDADPVTPGKQVVRLAGKNPSTSFARLLGAAEDPDRHLLTGCTGSWGILDGGVDDVRVPFGVPGQPGLISSAGFTITEDALGGDAMDVVAYGTTHSYAIVYDAGWNTNLVSWDPSTGAKLGTLYAPGGYSLSDVALNDRRELWVCNSSFDAPGLHVFRAGSDVRIAGPIATGLPPVQIVFDQNDDLAATGDEPFPDRFSLAPAPNPASTIVRLALALPRAGAARVEVFDLAGRRVRLLADGDLPSSSVVLRWNLADDSGRRVPPGLYLVRARAGRGVVTRRLVVIE
jgi:hypothetical protein